MKLGLTEDVIHNLPWLHVYVQLLHLHKVTSPLALTAPFTS